MTNAVKMALRILLNHVEPGWDNCKAIVQAYLDDPAAFDAAAREPAACACIEYYGSHHPDCPTRADAAVEAVAKQLVDVIEQCNPNGTDMAWVTSRARAIIAAYEKARRG